MTQREGFVGMQPDGAGKKTRTIEIVTEIDGVATTVQMQVLAIADGAGNVIDAFADYRLQTEMLGELQKIRGLLERWLGRSDIDVAGTQVSSSLTS